MKTLQIKWYYAIISMLFISLTFVACDEDGDIQETIEKEVEAAMGTSIVDVAIADADFSILVEALIKADLVSALDGESEYTVFAPTNDAFKMLLAELKLNSLDDIPKEELKMILLYHVVSGKNKSAALNTGYYSSISPKTDMYNYSIYFSKDDLMLNARAKVTKADIMADNGIIHVIDKVILPASITDFAVANLGLSNLTAAVVKAELAGVLDDDANDFTVFAPTNDAFVMLLESLEVSLDDLSKESLSSILLYHVVNGFVPAANVTSVYVKTLGMSHDNYLSALIDVSDAGVMINGKAKVVLTDVVATNGIIHVIDKVIMPNSVVDLAINNPAFSILVEAIVKADLVGALSADGPFTVLAPTNAAFETLFAALKVTGISDLTKEALTPILLAHVVKGNAQSGDLESGMLYTLNDSKSLDIVVGEGVTIDGTINVVLADVQGTNGVVHAIDTVIVP